MSRIGQAPIAIPAGVDVTIEGRNVTVKGPKGELSRTVPAGISVTKVDNDLVVQRPNDERDNRALHGLTRSLVNNMVVGVTDGFKKNLEIVGVGYRAEAQGPDAIRLALGFSHPVNVKAPGGHHVRGAGGDPDRRQRDRQGGRRPGRRRHPFHPQARAVQGQGRPVPGRARPAQGRQGREEVIMAVSSTIDCERPSASEGAVTHGLRGRGTP